MPKYDTNPEPFRNLPKRKSQFNPKGRALKKALIEEGFNPKERALIKKGAPNRELKDMPKHVQEAFRAGKPKGRPTFRVKPKGKQK